MPCAAPCGNGIRTRCRSCSGYGWSAGWISICPGSRRRWWVIRKREPRWQSAADRARVAAELIEEAASLTDESTIASPADVARAGLPPPISAELPPSAAPGGEAGAVPDAALAAPTLDDALARDPDNVALLVERAARLGAAQHYRAAQLDYEQALRVDPAHGEALTGLGVLLSRRGLWSDAMPPLRSEEHTSELQSPYDIVCRLLLEKKKKKTKQTSIDKKHNKTRHSNKKK